MKLKHKVAALKLLYILLPLICIPNSSYGKMGILLQFLCWMVLATALEIKLCKTAQWFLLGYKFASLLSYGILVIYALRPDDYSIISAIMVMVAYIPSLPYNNFTTLLYGCMPDSWLSDHSIWIYGIVMGSILCHIAVEYVIFRYIRGKTA